MKITKELWQSLGYDYDPRYAASLEGTVIPEGFEAAKPGDMAVVESLMWFDTWIRPALTGTAWQNTNCFLINPIMTTTKKAADKFSCGHGADPTDKFCRVCHVFMRLVTDRR